MRNSGSLGKNEVPEKISKVVDDGLFAKTKREFNKIELFIERTGRFMADLCCLKFPSFMNPKGDIKSGSARIT